MKCPQCSFTGTDAEVDDHRATGIHKRRAAGRLERAGMTLEKLGTGRYRYRGRYVIRTAWGPGPRGGEKPRWEVADDDAYGGISIAGTFTHMTRKGAMTEIDQNAAKDGEYKQVPAHIRESTGQFCTGGELWTKNGRCQKGCDHADHYSNDGHPECVDEPIIPGPATPLERGAAAMETTPEQWRKDAEALHGKLPD